MIRVERPAASSPSILDARYSSDGKSELERATEYMANRKVMGPAKSKGRDKKKELDKAKTFEFSRYKSAEVKEALEKLFHGKCAYCESFYSTTQPVDVEHYRPKGAVDGDATHPGYWWMAMAWSNLLPSCIDCNRRRAQTSPRDDNLSLVALQKNAGLDRTKQLSTGKACAFPIETGGLRCLKPGDDLTLEKAMLLDPTVDFPEDHLVFYVGPEFPVSLVGPKPIGLASIGALPLPDDNIGNVIANAQALKVSQKGAVSIQIYGLNRLGLVQARTRVLRDLEFLMEMSINLAGVSIEIKDRNTKLVQESSQASSQRAKQIRTEVDFNDKVLGKIGLYCAEIKDRLRAMTKPEAPYSAVSRAWIAAYLQGSTGT